MLRWNPLRNRYEPIPANTIGGPPDTIGRPPEGPPGTVRPTVPPITGTTDLQRPRPGALGPGDGADGSGLDARRMANPNIVGQGGTAEGGRPTYRQPTPVPTPGPDSAPMTAAPQQIIDGPFGPIDVPDLPPDMMDQIDEIGQLPWNQGKPRDQWNPYPPGSPHNPTPDPAPAAPPDAPAPNPAGGGLFGDSWLQSGGRNVTDLRSHADIWNRDHPDDKVEVFGSKGDKIRYRGRVYDAVIAAGVNGGSGKSWNDITDGGGDGDGGGLGIDPSYLEPWTTPFDFDAFSFDGFRAPDAKDVFSDPGYQFRRDEGRGVLEHSAAARGLLGSGGTLKDILRFGQEFGSQEYGNVFNRNLNTWGAARSNASDAWSKNYDAAWKKYLDAKDSWYKNQDNPFDKLHRLGSLGAGSAS